jgi:hypothetical protein
MNKKRIIKEDGRYLIYYTFEEGKGPESTSTSKKG